MMDVFLDADIPLTPAPPPGAAAPADASVEFVALDPTRIRLFRSDIAGDVTVRATVTDPSLGAARSWRHVKIACAFPLTDPDHYIGLRNADDKDIGMLVTLDGLDGTSRRIVAEEMERRYFVPVIRRVVMVKEEGSILTWDVETDRGRRLFYIQNLRDSVYEIVPNRRVLLTDKDGLRYDIQDVTALDAATYAILARAL
jgi:hypothetical protein